MGPMTVAVWGVPSAGAMVTVCEASRETQGAPAPAIPVAETRVRTSPPAAATAAAVAIAKGRRSSMIVPVREVLSAAASTWHDGWH